MRVGGHRSARRPAYRLPVFVAHRLPVFVALAQRQDAGFAAVAVLPAQLSTKARP